MWPNTELTKRLGISYPIIQSPLAGGIATPALVAAVSNSGGLGALGMGYQSAEQIRRSVKDVRGRTNKPFAINLFAHERIAADPKQIGPINQILQNYRNELWIGLPPDLEHYAPPLEEQLSVALEEKVPVVSFTFGVLPPRWIQKLKAAGILVVGTATTVREGLELEKAGVDMVVAQGYEAGGHRANFLGPVETSMIGTMALIPQMVDALKIPVIATGGIMDGRGVVAALALGAVAAQMGTAFMACPESGAHPKHKDSLLHKTEENIVLTRAYTGKTARGFKNRFTTEMATHEDRLAPYPVQYALTRNIRVAAYQQSQTEFMPMWAGQGVRLCTSRPAAVLMADIIKEVNDVIAKIRE
jgi:nitronate monooxygenase